jgi:putative ABC transport system permease protein
VFRLVLRKLAANRWLTLCLLVGFIVGAALVSGIPTYTSGILQRMLTRDLERFQEASGVSSGRYTVQVPRYSFDDPQDEQFDFASYEREMLRLARDVGLPVLSETRRLFVNYLKLAALLPRSEDSATRVVALEGLSDAADHIRIIQGRIYSPEPVDGTIEVVVTEAMYKERDLMLGDVFVATDTRDLLDEPLRLKVVGVFGMENPRDLWWFQELSNYDASLLTDYDLIYHRWAETSSPLLTDIWWSYAFDYHAITVGGLRQLVATLERQVEFLGSNRWNYHIPMLETLKAYLDRERLLTTTLWFLQMPVLLLLAFFIAMTSQLIVRHESNEIAILKSRGARSGQIFLAYLLEGLLLSAVAVAAGPPAGYLLGRIIGAANGFLEFVQRTAIPLRLEGRTYLVAAGCALLLTTTMLVPAWLASKTTIVLHKQHRARGERPPLWRRVSLDLVLLALAGYGWYGYRTQQNVLAVTGARATDLPIDPLLFLISTLFIVGAGLFFLRLYPLLVKLVFRAGRRVWPPGLYATLLGVSRGGGGEQYLMLFLVMTLATGVLDTKTARTLNRSVEEKIRYATGADIRLQEWWATDRPGAISLPGGDDTSTSSDQDAAEYEEPDFRRFTELKGVALATKVFRQQDATAMVAQDIYQRVCVMGIVPQEFATVAWFRSGLLPAHWNQYLNLLAASPMAMLVSEGLAKRYGVKPGDPIEITWNGQGRLDGIVYGIVPYWPAWNPQGDGEAGDEAAVAAGDTRELVVANLSHLQAGLAIEPYEIWMKLASGATVTEVYGQLADRRFHLRTIENASEQLVAAKNDPLLQGTNGALTLGFTVTLLVSTIGFLIYWIISMQSRTLQFGVYRAMGLSRTRVFGMIAWEQLFVSGSAVAWGAAIGNLTGDLFVPLLQLTASAAEQVPPFHVTSEPADLIRLYAVVAAVLVVGLVVLTAIAFRIRIAQAIKLGEE